MASAATAACSWWHIRSLSFGLFYGETESRSPKHRGLFGASYDLEGIHFFSYLCITVKRLNQGSQPVGGPNIIVQVLELIIFYSNNK